MINSYISKTKTIVLNRYLHVFVIIFFEYFGTTLFAYGNLNLVNLKGNTNNLFERVIFFFLDFSISMFMCISYGRQFSGGLYNPIVAVFRSLRKSERYPIPIAILYILCQVAGGITGSFIALFLDDVSHAPITTILPVESQIKRLITEMLGAMILTFMVQLISEKKMTFIEHNREFYVCIPMYYLIARTYSSKSNAVNPAFGIGFELVYCYSHNAWDVLPMVYIITVGPCLGAILSALLFEYGFRPMFPMKKQAVIERQLRKQEFELKEKKGYTPINNRWTLSEVMNQEQYPAKEEDFDFTIIAEEEYDDEIDSVDDEAENQRFGAPMMTDFENILHRNSRIEKTSIMIGELRNNRVSNLFKIQEKESLELEDDNL